MYGFRGDVLALWDQLPASPLEDLERLEQLEQVNLEQLEPLGIEQSDPCPASGQPQAGRSPSGAYRTQWTLNRGQPVSWAFLALAKRGHPNTPTPCPC